ncbi:MAG: recombinase RecT [Dehalococcoidia bacterium]
MPEPKKTTTQTKTTKPAAKPETSVSKTQPSASERFTGMVMAEYQNVVGAGFKGFSDRERRLIGNYFIAIDQALAAAEQRRGEKNNLQYSWQTINLPALAKDLAHYARIGLDMSSKNHLFAIPYKDTKNNRYTMTLMPGYEGIRYQALKYALIPPVSITVECLYDADTFKVFKKDRNNAVESYEFVVNDPFKRGKLVGVFGYLEFEQETMNKLLVFTTADVMKRKPKYASAEFWGGQSTAWENGKKVEVMIEGWTSEMYEKTMIRALCGDKYIPRDPEKIDASYTFVRAREEQFAEEAIEAEVLENGNGEELTLPEAPAKEPEKPKPAPAHIPDSNEPLPWAEPAAEPVPFTERDAADPEDAF